MNQKFLRSLKRGLGRGILEIRNAADKTQYFDEVLWCCLHDITYDYQVEGTKGLYLYTAICETGNKEYFEDQIIKKYSLSTHEQYNIQSSEVLLQFALNGSKAAKDALWQRYDKILALLSRYRNRYNESREWEDLAIRLTRVDGISVVKKYITDIASLMKKGKELEKLDIDWFIDASSDNCGKAQVQGCLEKIESSPETDEIRAYILEEEKKALEFRNSQAVKRPSMSCDEYRRIVLERTEEGKGRSKVSFYGIGRQFAFSSIKEEQIKLAQLALGASSEDMKEQFFPPFKYVDFPLPADVLLPYLKSPNQILSEIIVEVLSRFKSKKIYNTALELISTKGLEFVLPLFEKNYTKEAEQLIRKYVLKKNNIDHGMQMQIRDIFEKNKSATSCDILLHVYENGDCGYCRYGIVRAIYKAGILPNQLLSECLYDSYDDTQAWAAKIAKKRNVTA